MRKTVLITGASSGIGKAAADYFFRKGWNVAATMRSPDAAEKEKSGRIRYYRLDVTDRDSIASALQQSLHDFGGIDVVVNNAGYGAIGLFEAASEESIRRQFEANLFGLMSVTSEILPIFRAQKRGIIINISSMGGKVTFPLYSLYHASKFAVEGFSESLHYELRPVGVKVKLIQPGIIKTDFNTRSLDFFNDRRLEGYQDYVGKVMSNIEKSYKGGVSPEIVAGTIYKAATDGSGRLRYVTGKPAGWLLPLRKLLPDSLFFALVRGNIENK
ncbi:SDR family oxidoreductase [Paenibacillus sp. CAU 1782]